SCKSEDNSEKWPKSVIKLTKAPKTLLQEFKESFEERKKESHTFRHESCAAEIRNASGHTCRLNQSAVSKMLKDICQMRERRLLEEDLLRQQ
ncbi:8323_t:CDS:1, partial [Paraglomus occultum]